MDKLNYRVTQVEERVAENENKNTNAHKEFYKNDTDRLKFEATIEEKCKTRGEDIDQLKKDSLEFKMFMSQTTSNYASLNATLQAVSKDLKILMEKPAKRWDSLIGTLIACIVSGAIGMFLGG